MAITEIFATLFQFYTLLNNVRKPLFFFLHFIFIFLLFSCEGVIKHVAVLKLSRWGSLFEFYAKFYLFQIYIYLNQQQNWKLIWGNWLRISITHIHFNYLGFHISIFPFRTPPIRMKWKKITTLHTYVERKWKFDNMLSFLYIYDKQWGVCLIIIEYIIFRIATLSLGKNLTKIAY
jgi:hypothetical protein